MFRDAVLFAHVLVAVSARVAVAQDTTSTRPPMLVADTARMQPFRRAYDIIVHGHDSAQVIGERVVAMGPAAYAGADVWLVVETRTGLVPAAESLYLARDLRPIHWSAVTGSSRLAAEFVRDTLLGATATPAGKHNLIIGAPAKVLASLAMLETMLPLFTLRTSGTDSLQVMSVSIAGQQLLPAELAVVGEEELVVDSTTSRPTWVVALRGGQQHVLFWVEKATGATLRVLQPLPADVGTELEYRIRMDAGAPGPGK